MSKTKLTPAEKETIISFSKGDPNAYVFTYERTWISALNRLGAKGTSNGYGGFSYVIPKSWIRRPLSPRKERKET